MTPTEQWLFKWLEERKTEGTVANAVCKQYAKEGIANAYTYFDYIRSCIIFEALFANEGSLNKASNDLHYNRNTIYQFLERQGINSAFVRHVAKEAARRNRKDAIRTWKRNSVRNGKGQGELSSRQDSNGQRDVVRETGPDSLCSEGELRGIS